MNPTMQIDDPLNAPVDTNVLEFDGSFLISAAGRLRYPHGLNLRRAWAKAYGSELPPGSPYLHPPYRPDPTAIEGYVDLISSQCYFSGPSSTPDPLKLCTLIEVKDPNIKPEQFVYVWGLLSDNSLAEPDFVRMSLALTGHTNTGDTTC